jgi:phage terminase large subunit-like protein
MPSTVSPQSCLPRWSTERTDRQTYGGAVAAIAEMLGTPLMPWQRHVVDVALEIDPATGLLAHREVVVTVPRQAGKTTLLLSVMVWRALQWPDQRIVYTAQTAQDARAKWRDEHVPMLNRSTLQTMYEVRHSNGSEALRWRNGSLQTIVATTEKAGHGLSVDVAVADEFFSATDSRLEQSLKPAMITRPQPQFWFISTAGTSTSVALRQKVDRGRETCSTGESGGMAYFEWSAGEDAELDDLPALLASCHPAVGHTISLDALLADFASMELAEAERAYLNRWTAQVSQAPIPVSTWKRREDQATALVDDLVFAVDFTPDRASASIVASGPVDDRHGVELVDHRSGTEWVVSRCIELWDRWSPKSFVIDGIGPASSIIPDLEAAGIVVITTKSRDMAQACGRIYDAVLNDKLVHRGQPPLDAAIAGASKRKLGDAWAWSRSSSSVDISPLVAATLALWGATSVTEDKPAAPGPVFAY